MNEELLERFVNGVERLAAALETIASANAPESPDHRFPLKAYPNFDWSAIGAEPIARDKSGPLVVKWNGFTFVRRFADTPKYGKAIMFSRNAGRGEDGNEYHSLVKFSDNMALERLPDNFPQARPQPGSPTQPTTEEPAKTTLTRPLDTDVKEHYTQEAMTAENEFLFLTAVQKLYPTYTYDGLATIRKGVCGEGVGKDNAAAQLQAIAKYIAVRIEQERRVDTASAHKTAKREAATLYKRLTQGE